MYAPAYIWAKTLLHLIEKTDFEIDYSKGMDLVEINDSHLILHIPSPSRQEAVAAHRDLIERYLLEEFHLRRKLLILDDAGMEKRKQNPAPRRIRSLNEKYALESYVAGSTNLHALDAAVSVAEGSDKLLFLYGPSGCGKTHLLHAIANRTSQRHPGRKIVYSNTEQFIADLIYSLKREIPALFRDLYYDADLLLLDDLQFFRGKGINQQYLSDLCLKLLETGKRVVLSADCPPDALPYMDSMWKDCAVEVFLPDYETRLEIIRKKAAEFQLPLTEEMVSFLAGKLCDNVHQIEGVLKRILALRDLTGMELTMANITRVLSEI